jgi:16S rRNA (guanine527-N7)-methyltransferase
MSASALDPRARPQLVGILERARRGGIVGPGPVEPHLEHASAFADLVGSAPESFVDLGSGAGLPGLVLSAIWPETTAVLVEGGRNRAALIEVACIELRVEGRCRVARGRAEDLARDPTLRGGFELVVARGFGPPATTAECAVGFLRAGGRLVVSEPPGEPDSARWPGEGLRDLGLAGPDVARSGGYPFAVLTAMGPVDARWPRRAGLPARRPLWS